MVGSWWMLGAASFAVERVDEAVDYAVVPTPNALAVVVTYERGTLGAALAHDHVVVATNAGGRVRWDVSDPARCEVVVEVPVASLRVDPEGARARFGLEGTAPPEDRPVIEENLRSARQLDAERFPTLAFRATGCAARDDGRVDVSGMLTIHGVARPTTVAMTIDADGHVLRARGSIDATHADFGMTPFSAAWGAVRNAEPLRFELDVTARATP